MKLLGLGDNVVDCYLNTGECFPGGNAVNVAAHASLLGIQGCYLGNLGGDEMGGVLMEAMTRAGVDYSRCRRIPGTTTKRCNYIVTDGERNFQGIDLGTRWSGPLVLGEEELQYIREFDGVHCCCNAKMEDEMIKLKDIPGVLTYDFGEKEKYRNETYMKKVCGYLDMALFSCPPMNEEECRSFCEPYHQLGTRYVMITMGHAGQYVSDGKHLYRGEAKRITVVDPMGAGDSFFTAFVVSLLNAGWKKGIMMQKEAVESALASAAEYSAANCMKEGGFGMKAVTV